MKNNLTSHLFENMYGRDICRSKYNLYKLLPLLIDHLFHYFDGLRICKHNLELLFHTSSISYTSLDYSFYYTASEQLERRRLDRNWSRRCRRVLFGRGVCGVEDLVLKEETGRWE